MAILTSRSYVRATTILTSRSDVRDTKYLWGSRHTPSMKEGWICITSYDEKNHDIAHMMMTIGDPDRAMIEIQLWWLQEIQIEWWSRSSLVMIQIEWWSRSSPVMFIQLERWSRSSENDLKMKMTWRLRRLKMEMTRWSSWYREEDQCWKLCRKNTFLVKRECWCICNFGIYSSMYLMYCNSMFILGCIYYVIESCCHASMFW